MNKANIFDSESKDEEIQILLTFQSTKKVKLKIINGKLFGDLNDLGCQLVVDLASSAEKLVIEFLGHPDSIFMTQFGEMAENHVIPGSAVAFKGPIHANENKLEELFIFLDKFIFSLIKYEHGAHQDHLFLTLTSDLQATLEKTANEFLLTHGGQKIKSPIKFIFGEHNRLIHGSFLQKPKISTPINSEPIDLGGYFDGYRIHKHELFILNERGSQITIFFDNNNKNNDTIFDLYKNRHHPLIFVVEKNLDARSMETLQLITTKPIDPSPSFKLEP